MHLVDKKPKLYVVTTTPKRPNKAAFKTAFSARLKDAREETIFSQADVGAILGMSGNSYSKYENGNSMLQMAWLAPVCEKLYIDPWQLLTGRPKTHYPEIPAHLRNPDRIKARRPSKKK